MLLDKLRVFDGWDSLAAGMDAGRKPSLIEANQCAKARDTVFRGGVPKSRPGIRQLDLTFDNQLYYNPAGDSVGPITITDALIVGDVIFSQSAKFTPDDVGSIITSSVFTPITTITGILSATQAQTSSFATSPQVNGTVVIVGRANPVTMTDGGFISGATIVVSLTANFNAADIGKSIVQATYLPAGTFITRINSKSIAVMSAPSNATVAGVTFTIPDRTPTPNSTETFHDEPFQCASYYAPSGGNECIMATFGGRLFQITPGVRTARVREIQLSVADPEPVTFRGNHTGTAILADNAVFKADDIGFSITGGNLPANSILFSVASGKTAAIGTSPGAEVGITFTLHRKHTISRRNRRTIPQNWMVQADRWHITQDGESKPIIFDGSVARRATDDEVIVGKIMAYGLGRLIVTRGRDIYFGDLFGSHAGDPSDSVLQFTETKFLNEGFPAEIPYINGEVTAAAFFPSQDTSTGQGELVIFTERGAVSFDLHLARDKWKDSTFQQISLINSTARGDRAVPMINSDLWIRSDDGWRAYRQARAQALGWYQLPQSTEVTPWTRADTPDLLRYGSAINFDNRLIATCNPVPNQGRLYHDGILVLDFSVLSSFGQATRPAWDGHWSKLRTLQLVTGTFAGQHRAFAFGLDSDGTTQLYEISTEDREDFDGPITSEIEFRSHNFNAPFNEKNLYGADIWFDDTGPDTLSYDLSFRADSSQDYIPWKSGANIVPPVNCGEVTCGICPTIGVGFAPRIKIPKPKDDCDEYTGRLIRRGYEFQPKLTWTGHGSIRRMRLQAVQEEEDSKAEC